MELLFPAEQNSNSQNQFFTSPLCHPPNFSSLAPPVYLFITHFKATDIGFNINNVSVS